MKRLLLGSLLGCMLMSQMQLHAWNLFKKEWTVEDFIAGKCYEVEDRLKQQQCIEAKQFLMEMRKTELENKPIVLESAGWSVLNSIIGFLGGGVLGACNGDLILGAVAGTVIGFCTGPYHAWNLKSELHVKLPDSIKFYANCKKDPSLIQKTPKEVLDKLEYVLKIDDSEQRKQLANKITSAWAARVISE
jgi:hypothetical protein